ncbi:hypothetical protein J132_03081 [Termitomyces sp. J132]|nr:hypothetical protein J132_03081 [Termitomyces sp. J132]
MSRSKSYTSTISRAPNVNAHGSFLTSRENTTRKNWWSSYRQMLREPAAEFAGTMLLTIFGLGVNCQTVLSSNAGVSSSPKGDWTSVTLGWGAGIALGVWISGGISGGHVNPAVTLAMATWRKFPWKKVPTYIFAQLMGALVGAAIVYANYFHALDVFEGGRGIRTLKTGGLFSTFAADYVTNVSAFFSVFLATAILIFVIIAFTNRGNAHTPTVLLPLALFITLVGIAAGLGMDTGFAVNPACDLGPRLLTSMVGYGKAVYTFRQPVIVCQYWIWCPIIAPFLGAQFGALFYDAFLYNEDDGFFNKL